MTRSFWLRSCVIYFSTFWAIRQFTIKIGTVITSTHQNLVKGSWFHLEQTTNSMLFVTSFVILLMIEQRATNDNVARRRSVCSTWKQMPPCTFTYKLPASTRRRQLLLRHSIVCQLPIESVNSAIFNQDNATELQLPAFYVYLLKCKLNRNFVQFCKQWCISPNSL